LICLGATAAACTAAAAIPIACPNHRLTTHHHTPPFAAARPLSRAPSHSLKCKARQRAETDAALPLPGLPPPDPAGPAPSYHLEWDVAAARGAGVETAAARAALAAALRADLLTEQPVAAGGGGSSSSSGAGAGAVIGASSAPGAAAAPAAARQLPVRLAFEPRRALAATVPLVVVRSGGGRWAYDVHLAVGTPSGALALPRLLLLRIHCRFPGSRLAVHELCLVGHWQEERQGQSYGPSGPQPPHMPAPPHSVPSQLLPTEPLTPTHHIVPGCS
jgi:hypothetical protein